MPGIIVLFLLSAFYCMSSVYADWDPFSPLQRDQANIVIPSGASRPPSAATEENSNDWPVAESPQWQEDKDGYIINLPVRMPSDVDTRFISYKYADGVLKITAPKKKLKSII